MGRHENDIAQLQQNSADGQQQPTEAKIASNDNSQKIAGTQQPATNSPAKSASSGSEEEFDTQTEEMITTAWEKTKHVAEQTIHVAEGAWEKTKGAAVAVKESIVGKPHAKDEVARGKKDDDAANAMHDAAAAAAGEPHTQHDETLKEKVQHIAGAAWGKTKEVAEGAWEKTKGTAIAVKEKVINEETPAHAEGTEAATGNTTKIPDAPSITPSLPSDAHPIAPTNQRDLQIDRKQLKVPIQSTKDIPTAELPKDEKQLHAEFERDQLKAPMRSDGGIGHTPAVSELTFGGGAPNQEDKML